MAKFANITYGTKGDTEQYTYIVNDSVRTGDFIHPSVKHPKSGKVYGTTGIIQSTAKETSKTGQKIKQEMQSKGAEPTKAYTGKEVGAKRGQTETGAFEKSGLTKTVKNEDTGMRQAKEGSNFQENQYVQQARQGNVDKRQQSYDDYAKKYIKGDK